MNIGDILTENQVVENLSASDKTSALQILADHVCQNEASIPLPPAEVMRALVEREHLGSTGVGEGVAIPHAKIPGLSSLVACFGRAPKGIPFDAIDQQPVRLIFVLLVPENSAGAHLKALARISRLMKNPQFRGRLLDLPTASDIFAAFLEEDARH